MSTEPIGTERMSSHGNLIRKVRDTGILQKDWQYVHHLIWREAGRKIPRGYLIYFLDGDRTNVTLENLGISKEHIGIATKKDFTVWVETCLKKERRTKTGFPIGTKRMKNGYVVRKVACTGDKRQDWDYAHHLIWREAGREIPPECFLCFRDGNTRNVTLENLELVKKSEMLRRTIKSKRPVKQKNPSLKKRAPIKTDIPVVSDASIGCERLRGKYLIRKVASTGDESQDWDYVHHIIWREAGGEIPPGYILYFLDDNPCNLTLSNIEIATRSELAIWRSSLRGQKKTPLNNEKLKKIKFAEIMKRVKAAWLKKQPSRHVHHPVLSEAGGEIPPEYIVTFRDGSPRNASFEDLVITRTEFSSEE